MTIDVDVPASLPMVVVDRVLLARALTNMIENALHAMPGGGTLTIKAEAGAIDHSTVGADTGTGMDPEALRRIFEPYFSTKATGTGLGSDDCETKCGAERRDRSTCESSPGKGTTVMIELPVGDGRVTKNVKRRRIEIARFTRYSFFALRFSLSVHVRRSRCGASALPMVPARHEHLDERRQHVAVRQRHERERGVRRDERDQQRDDAAARCTSGAPADRTS